MKILLDNSFREKYCYFKGDNQMRAVCEQWDVLIGNIENYLTEAKFKLIFPDEIQDIIEVPLCFIESIGFKKELPDEAEIEKCFSSESELSVLLEKPVEESFKEIVHFIDEHIGIAFHNLVNLFSNEINIDLLIKKSGAKLKEKVHPKVEILKYNLALYYEDFVLNQKEAESFKQICNDLAWDALMKHCWIRDDDPKYVERKNSESLWFKLDEERIVLRLLCHYFDQKTIKGYLPGATPLIIYGRLLNKEQRKNIRPYRSQERVDTYMADYSFTGWYNQQTQQHERVVVLTCDLEQRKKIEWYAKAKKEIDKKLEKIGKQHLFVPGYIICIDQNNHQVVDFIDIANEFQNLS